MKELVIHSFNRLITSDKYKEVKHFERIWISKNAQKTRIKDFANISLQRHFNKSHGVVFWYKNASINNGKRGKWSDPITGLFATSHSMIYYGDISERDGHGYARKVSILFFVFKYDNSRMVVYEYPNYYPPAGELETFVNTQVEYIKRKLKI